MHQYDNDYQRNTVVGCKNCGGHRLTLYGETTMCETCGTDQAHSNDGPDSSGWDRIWRLAAGQDIKFKRF